MARWTREQVLVLYGEYEGGKTLASIAAEQGVSHEAIRYWFEKYDLVRRGPEEVALVASQRYEELLEQAEQRRDGIIACYKQHGTIDAVVAHFELPRRIVAAIVDEIPNREAYRRRGVSLVRPREELLSDLQRAKAHAGEPLTIPGYRDAAKALGLASYDTQIRCFEAEDPVHPWAHALKVAGIKGNPPQGKRPRITPEQCIDAVVRCITEHGGQRVSYDAYREWATFTPGAPSGPTVRKALGWNAAVDKAFDKLASV